MDGGYGGGVDPRGGRALAQFAVAGLEPVLVIVLDVSVEITLARLGTERDRIESAEPAFHQRVRTGFLAQADADPERWAVLDGSDDIERVSSAVEALVEERLGLVIVDR